MTRPPEFDEIVEADDAERERLRRVHDMLVLAGPPAELTPELAAGPTLQMTLGRFRGSTSVPRHQQRRVALVAAAFVVLALAFLMGYLSGHTADSAQGQLLRLAGTAAAPQAEASLRLADADGQGNYPMDLAAVGLPKLGANGYYEVFLVRNGKIVGPCGAFLVKSSGTPVSVNLTAPYAVRGGDNWIVTKQSWGDRKRGPVVLRPLT
jgi:hypothetical protein